MIANKYRFNPEIGRKNIPLNRTNNVRGCDRKFNKNALHRKLS